MYSRGRYRSYGRRPRRYYGRSYFTGRGKYSKTRQRLRTVDRILRNPLVAKGVPAALIMSRNPYAMGAGVALGTGLRAYGGVRNMFSGRGMYKKATSNSIAPDAGGLVLNTPPRFYQSKDETGALTISHTEFVGNVYGNKAGVLFSSQKIPLQPGSPEFAPLLSSMAPNWNEYELKQCMFFVEGTVKSYITNSTGQLGEFVAYTDYSADASRLIHSKHRIMNDYASSRASVTDNMYHGVECSPKKIVGDAHKFIRTGGIGKDASIQDYDAGVFVLGVHNTPDELAERVIGNLYVSYTVTLRKPRVHVGLGLAIQQDEFISNGTSSPYEWWPSGGNYALSRYNGIGCTLSEASSATSATTHQSIIVTFPSSFSGAVEIVVSGENLEVNENTVLRKGAFVWPEQYTGNVKPLSDIPCCCQQTEGTTDPLNTVSSWTSAQTKGGGVSIIHVFVEPAVGGEINTIKLRGATPPSNSSADNPRWHNCFMKISRYNNHDMLREREYIHSTTLEPYLPNSA